MSQKFDFKIYLTKNFNSLYGIFLIFDKREREGALIIKMVPKLLYKRFLIGWLQKTVGTFLVATNYQYPNFFIKLFNY